MFNKQCSCCIQLNTGRMYCTQYYMPSQYYMPLYVFMIKAQCICRCACYLTQTATCHSCLNCIDCMPWLKLSASRL